MTQFRQIANRLWEELSSPRTALLIFVVLSLLQITALALPQIPVPASQSTAYTRWLAEFRPRLGPQTGDLASWGLLTIRSSLGMRLTLSLLGLLVAANLDSFLTFARQNSDLKLDKAKGDAPEAIVKEGELVKPTVPEAGMQQNDSQSARQGTRSGILRASYALLAIGGTLVIGGWAARMHWAWQEPGVIAWPGTQIVLPQHGLTLKQPEGFLGFWQGEMGLYILSRGERIGIEVHATQDDVPLRLLPSVNEEPREVLHLALTVQEPEAFFATEEATLIFRLIQVPEAVQIQAYRSPSGELVAEMLFDGSESPLVLHLDGMQIALTLVPLPNYEVIYNPGAVFEVAGMASLLAGVIIQISLTQDNGRKRPLVLSPREE